jgi:hypothetical protein
MLPGIPASGLQAVAKAALFTSAGLAFVDVVSGILLRAAFGHRPLTLESGVFAIILISLGGLLLVAMVIAAAASSRAYRMEAREIGTGYTTLLKHFDHVDGIDPKTGIVVRPARPPRIGDPSTDSITTGAECGAIDVARSPLQIVLRAPAILICIVSSVFVFVVSLTVLTAALFGSKSPTFWSIAALLVLLVALASTVSISAIAMAVVPPRRYGEILAEHFPNAHIYAGHAADPNEIVELREPGALALPGAEYRLTNYFVFGPEHLIMLSRHRRQLVPFASIPRSRVRNARVSYASPRPGPLLTVQKNNGSTVDLALSLGGMSGLASVSELTEACNWVVGWSPAKP